MKFQSFGGPWGGAGSGSDTLCILSNEWVQVSYDFNLEESHNVIGVVKPFQRSAVTGKAKPFEKPSVTTQQLRNEVEKKL